MSKTRKRPDGLAARQRIRLEVWELEARLAPSSSPVAVDDIYYISAPAQSLNITAPGLLANDIGSDLSAYLVDPGLGFVTVYTDGSFDWDPPWAEFSGTDTFTYEVTDGWNYSNVATVTITTDPPPPANQPPVANEDFYWVAVNGELEVPAANGVLANDTDPDDDPLTAELLSGPSYGDLIFYSDGSFTYTPNQDFQGTDSFEYRAHDGTDFSDPVFVNFQVAQNRVFVVNTVEDTQDANPGDGFAQDNQGLTSLRAAIEEAHALQENDFVIEFAPALNGQTISLGIALPNLNKNFEIIGLGATDLTIQRNPAVGDFRIFTINGDKEVDISGITLSNGRATGFAPQGHGGAIYNAGTLYLSNMVLCENYATSSGGAIFNALDATLSIEASSIYDNTALWGGGIYNMGEADICDSEIFVNEATFEGGGIYNHEDGFLAICRTDVYHNWAELAGGGIANFGELTWAFGLLLGNEVTGNSGKGGGLYNEGETVDIENVGIKENKADGANGKGGGVYVMSGTVTTTDCTYEDNSCGLQGGGSNGCWWPGATLSRNNCNVVDGTFFEDPDA